MDLQEAREEYSKALRLGLKQADELAAANKPENPEVLDELLPDINSAAVVEVGLLEIPAEKIIGVKSAGRITAFTPSFLPLLSVKTEFASKWAALCVAHMEEGIRDPITCYEYLGNFYVQEGNKRVSVLRYFGAVKIPAVVKRVMPPKSQEPRILAYYEFLDFFTVQFRRPKDYQKLMSLIGKEPGIKWTEDERRTFSARLQYFRDALATVKNRQADVLPEEALLLWLKLYPFEDLSNLSTSELKKSVAGLWEDMVSASTEAVKVETGVAEEKPGILTRFTAPDHVNVAFIHQLSPEISGWTLGHDKGREYMEQALGERVTARSYYKVNTPEETDRVIEQAISEGAQVIFTTVPQMSNATLKAAVKYPKVFFFNCSISQPYSSIRTYYGRVFEGKFITGAIAGAMAQNNRIGYIASYPILGVPASINAFALGALFTNPRAQIELRWSCLPGSPQADFLADGIRVVSNRDVPVQSKNFLDFCSCGTYLMDDVGGMIPLASPVWAWGKFYEQVIRGILSGSLRNEKAGPGRNYWMGMDTGVIELDLSERLPEGVRTMAKFLQRSMIARTLDPFARRIVASDGTVKNPSGDTTLSLDELLHMDWLCENVSGSIPTLEEVLPMSRDMVRELGVFREKIPAQKEARKDEAFNHLR